MLRDDYGKLFIAEENIRYNRLSPNFCLSFFSLKAHEDAGLFQPHR